MADTTFHELLGDTDSEDDNFMGFEELDNNNLFENEDTENNYNLTEADLREIEREIYEEEHDPHLEAYNCEWLKTFNENAGPAHVVQEAI